MDQGYPHAPRNTATILPSAQSNAADGRLRLLVGARWSPSALHTALQASGHSCDLVDDLEDMASAADHSGPFDLAVIEVDTIRQSVPAIIAIRRRGIVLPIVVVTGMRTDRDEEQAYHAGADAVLLHTIELGLLVARCRAILRRIHGHSSAILHHEKVCLDQSRHIVSVDDQPLALTAREFELLEWFLLRRGTILTKADYMARVYGDRDDVADERILDVLICKLRRKLVMAGGGSFIRTIRNIGYVFEPASGPRRQVDAAAPELRVA